MLVNELKDKIKSENPKMTEAEINKKIAEEMAKAKAKAEKIQKEVISLFNTSIFR